MALVDLGHGRGLLEQEAAESIWRIDAQLGYPMVIDSAWRDPVTQAGLRHAWERWDAYQRGVGPVAPWAPFALRPEDSWHCKGLAVDTRLRGAILDENGWIQTNDDEAWHRDRYPHLDRHLNDSPPIAVPTQRKRDTMRAVELAGAADSGIIIQDGCLPNALPRQTFDALCGAYGLTSQVLADWQYGTVIREQWAVYAQNNPTLTLSVDLDAEDVEAIAAQVRAGLPLEWKVTPA